MWHKLRFSYIIDTIISKTTHIPLLFNAADMSVFLETNAYSQTNNALPTLKLRMCNIPVVDTLSWCDTTVQFSWTVLFPSLFVMWKVILLLMPFGSTCLSCKLLYILYSIYLTWRPWAWRFISRVSLRAARWRNRGTTYSVIRPFAHISIRVNLLLNKLWVYI